MSRPPFGAGLLVIAGLLVASRAAAAPPRVAIVASDHPDAKTKELTTRMRAELLSAGFDVVTATNDSATDPVPTVLERAAAQTGSVAAISLVQSAGPTGPAEVWLVDRVTGKTMLRRVRTEDEPDPSPELFALRAVELLRASLLELNEPHPPRGDAPASRQLKAWVAPKPSRSGGGRGGEGDQGSAFWFTVDGVIMAGPGGVPPVFAPSLTFAYRPNTRFGFELRGIGPSVGSVGNDRGSAAFHEELVTLAARYIFLASPDAVSPFLLYGAGVRHIGAAGSTTSDAYTGLSGNVWSAVLFAGTGLRLPISASLAVLLQGEIGFDVPRPVLTFGSGRLIYTGRPGGIGTAGLEVGW